MKTRPDLAAAFATNGMSNEAMLCQRAPRLPDEVEERVERVADGGSALEHIVGDAVDAPRRLGHRPLNRHERREQALRQAVLDTDGGNLANLVAIGMQPGCSMSNTT